MIHGGDIYTQKIKQDFSVNMNPYPIPESVRECLIRSISNMHHYPDPMQREFRRKIAEVEKVKESQVVGGNGASEILLAIVHALMPKQALLISPGFYGYRHALQSVGCEVGEYLLQEADGFLLREDVLEYISKDIDIVFLTNPNNPTGRNIDRGLLYKILDHCRRMQTAVVLDECFLRMSDATGRESMGNAIEQYENLFIVNAFTKLFTLPGVRTGYLISREENVEAVKRQLSEWNMSVMSQEVSTHCCDILLDTDFEEKSLDMIQTERDFLRKSMEEMGICVYPSDTGFLLIHDKEYGPKEESLYQKLLSQQVLIRDCSNFNGLKQGYYRIAVKQHEENLELIRKIRKCYED